MNFLKQRIKNNLQSRSGFTLVELIVVLVILAILAAFTIPAMLGFVEDAKGKAAIAEAREVYVAAQAAATDFYSSNNSGKLIAERVAGYVASDLGTGTSEDEIYILVSKIDVQNDKEPVIYDGVKKNRIAIKLGNTGSGKENIVEYIKYLDSSETYIVTITPDGAAEITKLK